MTSVLVTARCAPEEEVVVNVYAASGGALYVLNDGQERQITVYEDITVRVTQGLRSSSVGPSDRGSTAAADGTTFKAA